MYVIIRLQCSPYIEYRIATKEKRCKILRELADITKNLFIRSIKYK